MSVPATADKGGDGFTLLADPHANEAVGEPAVQTQKYGLNR